jgi:hypothetical protein
VPGEKFPPSPHGEIQQLKWTVSKTAVNGREACFFIVTAQSAFAQKLFKSYLVIEW